MRVCAQFAPFVLAAAVLLAGCERRTPDNADTSGQADKPRPIAPAAKGIDAPPPVSPAPAPAG